MNPATLHGVGVIFAAFKESMTLNLALIMSFKVIHVGSNRKPVYDFI